MPILFKERAIRLSEGCPKLEILHLSDSHLRGPNPSLEKIIKGSVSQKVYDLVFLTGDLVDERGGVSPFIEYLSLLKARYGIFAVLGNHDQLSLRLSHIFFFNADSVDKIPRNDFVEELKSKMGGIGIRILSDEFEMITIGGHEVCIVGLRELLGIDRLQNWHCYGGWLNSIRALFKTIPAGSLTLVLSHAPDVIERLDDVTIHVMFAGHTHGGQIRLPILGPLFTWSSFQRKYSQGLYNYNGAYLHISPGLGSSRFTPLRFNCPSEITLVKINGSA